MIGLILAFILGTLIGGILFSKTSEVELSHHNTQVW